VLCAALTAVLVAGCGGGAPSPRRFTVGFDADFPPYGFKDGSAYRGFDLDLARAVCARRGWTFVARPINWDAKDMELASGAIDCIWNGFTIQGRENAYTWSAAYIDNSQVVLVRAASPVRRLADLSGRVVGVQTGTPVEKALTGKTPSAAAVAALGRTFRRLVVAPNYNQAVQELEMGAVEAVALDVGVARRKMADRPGRFRMLDDVVMRENYGIGFRKGDTALRDAVEADLCALADDGTMAALARTYGIEESALLLVGPRRRLVHADETAASVSRPGLLAMGRELLDGLVVSVEIFALTLLLALPLGFVVAFGRMASNRCVSALFRLYISILRGTPLMLQILFVYFAPNILFGLSLESYPRFLATVLAFSFNYAAYFAEIYRGGILSIDAGQREAAAALGLGRVQTFRRIILPQTIKRVLPAVGNEVITLVKDTSLAFTVSVLEMFTIARQLAAAHTTVAPLVAAGVFYYVFNDLVAWLLGRLERRLSYYD
jgi:polar amino acid transport system substrate-binding protein